ncbi:MAG: molybdate ABC transporter substrate-binding protein [Gallionella sp.]|nr:molybdate ABC transporter substrate-binding protein [Gallionella sp.]
MFSFALRGRIAAVVVLFGLMSAPVCAGDVRVAVASDFAAPMERIVTLFRKQSGHTVDFSLGSSGKFYAQIKGGEPFDVFLSADEELPKRLTQEGLAVGGTRFVYALGRLVLWSAQPGLVDAKGKVLRNGSYNKLAIADPRLSPYGMAAKETLEKLAMWNGMQRKLEKSEDITQSYQLAVIEKADLAFIALSQIMRDGKVKDGSWWLVPPELYRPIRQSAVLITAAQDQEAAQAFLDFLGSKQVSAIIQSFGYELP